MEDTDKRCILGVSIAKPLCSAADPNLRENLSSYFELQYPEVGRFLNAFHFIQFNIIMFEPTLYLDISDRL